ncbi:hypothetical protein BKA70DRAFT_814661 [Coprinopsis sp. MPI-PUGE-AT-0042]|nr:hypothetical protein BKA70DRAFT_814661 [Coprinopsis sp. MPI-PUGE-AT-0042]
MPLLSGCKKPPCASSVRPSKVRYRLLKASESANNAPCLPLHGSLVSKAKQRHLDCLLRTKGKCMASLLNHRRCSHPCSPLPVSTTHPFARGPLGLSDYLNCSQHKRGKGIDTRCQHSNITSWVCQGHPGDTLDVPLGFRNAKCHVQSHRPCWDLVHFKGQNILTREFIGHGIANDTVSKAEGRHNLRSFIVYGLANSLGIDFSPP